MKGRRPRSVSGGASLLWDVQPKERDVAPESRTLAQKPRFVTQITGVM